MATSFLRLKEVVRMTGLCKSSIYNRRVAGEFPKAYSLGGKTIAWKAAEIEAWCAACPPAEADVATRRPAPRRRPKTPPEPRVA